MASTIDPTPLKKGRKRGATKEPTPAPEEADELDLMAGTTEDDFTEAIAHVRERELLFGPQSLLANFGPMVADICANNTSYNHPTLQAQAALCLAKLMCVSSEYCETNLGLLLTILERSQDAVVRSNLVVALGDMAVCFNHLIDENTDFLYRRLNDGDPSVKRTCLMTLTFLILAGQVKVKGQLGEMAKCLEDSDKKIADMARMFFTELSTKDNAVYNQFIDMFSVLSADSTLSEDALKRIVKFLAGFIEKVCSVVSAKHTASQMLTTCRTNTPNNYRLNLPLGYRERKTRDSGTMSHMHWANSSTKMRRYKRCYRKASRLCRRLLEPEFFYADCYDCMDMMGVIPWVWGDTDVGVLAAHGIVRYMLPFYVGSQFIPANFNVSTFDTNTTAKEAKSERL
jgi:hypothetical protein